MSFHKDSFHETKRERKYYEKRKEKVMNFIAQLQDEYANSSIIRTRPAIAQEMINDLERIKEKVYEI